MGADVACPRQKANGLLLTGTNADERERVPPGAQPAAPAMASSTAAEASPISSSVAGM